MKLAKTFRPRLESLEDRTVPASFTASTVSELVAHINAANLSPEADTITLAPGKMFTLTAPAQAGNPSTGLPPTEAAGGALTIVGNGATVERSTGQKTPAFGLIFVGAGAVLRMENLTLQGGLATGYGGAVYNAGTLTLDGVTAQKNTARGAAGSYAAGGAIYSLGSLTLQGCLIRDNLAVGGDGSQATRSPSRDVRNGWDYTAGTDGGWAGGGGVYVAGGTASLFGTTVTGNEARGGKGGAARYGQPGGNNGIGEGGGVYFAFAAVTLDAFTVSHVTQNTADNPFYADIFGTYTIAQ